MLRFAYRLAAKLGRVNARAMLGEITWRQFVEWTAYADLEPFDEERQDARLAQVVAMIANVNRNPKKRRRPYALTDFMLRFGDLPQAQPRQQTWQEQKALGYRMFQMFNARERAAQPKRQGARVVRRQRGRH